jgi:hypothetical protein
MSQFNIPCARDLLQNFAFQDLFIDELGWNHPPLGCGRSLTVPPEQTLAVSGLLTAPPE